MKVAMICDVMGQPNNGTTLAALNLIRYLRDAGHTVTVVAPGGEASDGYLPVRVWHAGPLIDRILRMNGVELAVPDKQLLEAVIREADVVHLLIPLPLARAALKIARRLGKPVTASFHCQAENITAHLGMMNAGWLNRLIYRNFYRKVYRWCTAVHYPTEFIREVFETATHPTPAHVISNGVNDMFRLPDSRPENGKFTVVCSGRYSREKAQQQLLRAAALCRHRDDIRLILAGDGPRRKHYLRLAKQYGLDCQFAFFPRQELLHILQTADLYVHTAIIEIEAIACTEAICCGLVPVICNSDRSATRFFACGDHTRAAGDAFTPSLAAFPRRPFVLVHPDAVAVPGLRQVVRALGGIPVPTDIRNLGRFHGELLKLSPGNCVVIYPEAHIWPCYTGVRPFRDSSFRYPVETGQPVFAFTVTYRRHLILPLPRTVVYIDGPFFPDSALTLRQNQRKLRDEVYNAMCRRSQKSNFRYHEYVEQTEEA